jgi:hypothetical protein
MYVELYVEIYSGNKNYRTLSIIDEIDIFGGKGFQLSRHYGN